MAWVRALPTCFATAKVCIVPSIPISTHTDAFPSLRGFLGLTCHAWKLYYTKWKVKCLGSGVVLSGMSEGTANFVCDRQSFYRPINTNLDTHLPGPHMWLSRIENALFNATWRFELRVDVGCILAQLSHGEERIWKFWFFAYEFDIITNFSNIGWCWVALN